MKRTGWVVLLLAVAGCRGKGDAAPPKVDAAAATRTGGEAAAPDTTLPAMPDFPNAAPGMLKVVSAGSEDLGHEWKARAGLCETPAVLMVQGSEPGFGALLVLTLLPKATRLGHYPVSYSLSGPPKLPDPPAAQLGVQRILDNRVLQFQGLEGDVQLYGLAAKASGRFQVTLRDVASNRPERLAGSFADVPVEVQSRDYCAAMAAAGSGRDSSKH